MCRRTVVARPVNERLTSLLAVRSDLIDALAFSSPSFCFFLYFSSVLKENGRQTQEGEGFYGRVWL